MSLAPLPSQKWGINKSPFIQNQIFLMTREILNYIKYKAIQRLMFSMSLLKNIKNLITDLRSIGIRVSIQVKDGKASLSFTSVATLTVLTKLPLKG